MKIRKLKKGECKDIVKIQIVFENCEYLEFTREEIGNIFLHNIRKSISLCLNAVIEDYEAEEIFLAIPETIAKTPQKIWNEKISLWERLGLDLDNPHRDITHIHLFYNTNEEEEISCVWNGDQFDNPAQKVTIEEDELTKQNFVVIEIKERDDENGKMDN